MSPGDLDAILVTLALAGTSTLLLLLFGTPLAWWLARGGGRLRAVINAVIALPLVLPPTVLGFYLLLAFAPDGVLGGPWLAATGRTLAFSFAGLVLGSLLYSLPFVVQPLQQTFRSIDPGLLDAAADCGAGPLDRFRSVVLPLSLAGFAIAATLAFAHTVGEFGVVLMIGGNIPGETRVLSIALFDHVETLDYGAAHRLAAGLLAFSLAALLIVNLLPGRGASAVGRSAT